MDAKVILSMGSQLGWLTTARLISALVVLLFLAALAGGVGCGHRDPPWGKGPAGSTNFKDLGNDWVSFECDVAGKKRTFLAHRLGYTHQVVVELKN